MTGASICPNGAPPRRPSAAPAPRPTRARPALAAASASTSSGRGGGGGGASPLPIVILPGLGNASSDYASFAAALRLRGAPSVVTAPVARPDWLRNAAGLVKKEYWTGKLTPLPTTAWYCERIEAAVAQALAESGGEKVALVAHSAGGWLARTWLLERAGALTSTASLVTLGSPHSPPPPDSGLPDQTRGILTWVSENTPGAFHPELSYTTVAGRFLKGAPLLGKKEGTSDAAPVSLAARLAGFGYEAVCGRPDVWGDSITPVESAHLEGARQVTLEGVFHGPLGASADDPEGGEADKNTRFWYGSACVIDSWAPEALGLAPLGGRLLAAGTQET